MAQMKGCVTDNVENAPPNGDGPVSGLPMIIQLGPCQTTEYLARLRLSRPQELDQLGGTVNAGGKLCIPVPFGRMPTQHFTHPKTLRASHVSRKHGQGIGGMLINPFQWPPVQRLHWQVCDQVTDLAPQIIDHLLVAL
jgi:hypothetical protein